MSPEARLSLLLLPLLLLLLLQAPLNSANAGPGQDFTVVFPENIADYHPTSPENHVWVTALYDDTTVTVDSQDDTLDAGQTERFHINLELKKLKIQSNSSNPSFLVSNKTTKVISNKDIVLQAVSNKNNSLQTAVIIPTDRLGTKYFIPPVPKIQGATIRDSITSINERGPFRLIIVNTDQDNTVTVGGPAGTRQVSLKKNQVAQTWVLQNESLQEVTAEKPVAVLFSHPCAFHQNCICRLLYALLPPATSDMKKFLVPPLFNDWAQTSVLLSETGSRREEPCSANQAFIDTAGSAVLYRPGLLLPLVSEENLGSCFVVKSIGDTNYAVIVVRKNETAGVQIGDAALNRDIQQWQELGGTDYVSTNVSLTADQNIIWHKSSKMAVYFVGRKDDVLFGNPAPALSATPDSRGCVVVPEVLNISSDPVSWQESVASCQTRDQKLASLSSEAFRRHVCSKLPRESGVKEVWIGMRRSSVTGEWYWLDSTASVNETHWDEGSPGTVDGGQCVSMSLKNSKDFVWQDQDCCKAANPLCYREPVLMPLS
ncbi:hypothetical protein OJAV_G00164320 [Oryzias javanicus]|uniref:C-type lectin domain-containing protein n=1 Tax=Oryzias javanicus TaxID=123683 RepID=A0A3S2PWY0_ORYJA|nr:hypothetical protein OJAV_G00164320 [Oryzias javanicus]